MVSHARKMNALPEIALYKKLGISYVVFSGSGQRNKKKKKKKNV
jgi:hypothetical protein